MGKTIAFLIFFLPALFMWQVVIQGKIAFPGDLLVGAYYPWQQNIPVKNPLISDVFSQIFSWKYLISQSYLNKEFPLWNKFTMSGYPLLANYHSGALYPLNLFLILNFLSGWNFLLFLQFVISITGMYFFCRLLNHQKHSSLIAAVSYAFSGFALVYWQVIHAGHTMAWLPFILIVLTRKQDLWRWPIFFFLIVTAGHFQGTVYTLALSVLYYLIQNLNAKKIILGLVTLVLGLIICSAQILPTLELSKFSVRLEEKFIQNINYGLLPWSHLSTWVAPDFFGNATTYNYWGVNNYQETSFYVGIAGFLAVVWGVWNARKLNRLQKFFLIVSIVTLLMGFTSPIGKIIYWLNIPALATSSASRIFMIFAFASNLLVATFFDYWSNLKPKELLRLIISIVFIISTGFIGTNWRSHEASIVRNLVIPGILLGGFVLLSLIRKVKFAWVLILGLVILDLFRFGWKYNPFVDIKTVFPETSEISFLKSVSSLSRVDRENGPVLPSNTWEMYGIMSASGYDPVGLKDYAHAYHVALNNPKSVGVTRYVELSRFDAQALGKFGVGYLLIRKNVFKENKFSGWKPVFTSERMIVLENEFSHALAYYKFPSSKGRIDINKWDSNNIEISTDSIASNELIIATNFYPGWKATVNNLPVVINKTAHNFSQVNVSSGKNQIRLEYKPISFQIGLYLTIIGGLLVIGMGSWYTKFK